MMLQQMNFEVLSFAYNTLHSYSHSSNLNLLNVNNILQTTGSHICKYADYQ